MTKYSAGRCWVGNRYFVPQGNYKRISWLNTKSGRLVSVLIDITVAHVAVRIERVPHCQLCFQNSILAPQVQRLGGWTPFNSANARVLNWTLWHNFSARPQIIRS